MMSSAVGTGVSIGEGEAGDDGGASDVGDMADVVVVGGVMDGLAWKHGRSGLLQQAACAGHVRAAASAFSRHESPQQNVPVMQQSGMQGPVVPDSCWMSVGASACPVATAEPLVPALPLKLPSVTTVSAEFELSGVLAAGNRSRSAQAFAPFKQHPSTTGTHEL